VMLSFFRLGRFDLLGNAVIFMWLLTLLVEHPGAASFQELAPGLGVALGRPDQAGDADRGVRSPVKQLPATMLIDVSAEPRKLRPQRGGNGRGSRPERISDRGR
jgi:hypothetical protein